MGVAGPEPAMAGASVGSPIVPRARRAYALTAPPNLNGKKALTLKREAPTIWELQSAMAASELAATHTHTSATDGDLLYNSAEEEALANATSAMSVASGAPAAAPAPDDEYLVHTLPPNPGVCDFLLLYPLAIATYFRRLTRGSTFASS